jgi:hypothetical protein
MVSGCRKLCAVVAGREAPAMSVSWEKPRVPWDSGFCVFFADADLEAIAETDDVNDYQGGVVCFDCLLDDGGEQLGRGLNLAREHGQADFDADADEWFVPGPEDHWQTTPVEESEPESRS